MARPGVKAVSVYITDKERDILAKAAVRENRSVSNFLLTHALEKAAELGVVRASGQRTERVASGGRKR